MRKAIASFLALLIGVALLNLSSTDSKDEAAIKAAVADYVEGIYLVQPERIDRSVDVTLRKYGYWRPDDKKEYTAGREMNFKQLRDLAATWNKNGRVDPKTEIKEISILDKYDQTASAKLVAYWGIDYFHLAKEDGQWKIINVIWQSHPPKE